MTEAGPSARSAVTNAATHRRSSLRNTTLVEAAPPPAPTSPASARPTADAAEAAAEAKKTPRRATNTSKGARFVAARGRELASEASPAKAASRRSPSSSASPNPCVHPARDDARDDTSRPLARLAVTEEGGDATACGRGETPRGLASDRRVSDEATRSAAVHGLRAAQTRTAPRGCAGAGAEVDAGAPTRGASAARMAGARGRWRREGRMRSYLKKRRRTTTTTRSFFFISESTLA